MASHHPSPRSRRARLDLTQLHDRVTPSVVALTLPTANDDVADTDGNNPVAIAILANDSAAGGMALNPASVRVVSGPARGTVSIAPATGTATYTATGFFMGTDSFRYAVRNASGTESAPATVTVVVNRPTANDDFADTPVDTPVAIPVLANDTDPDGNGKLDSTTVRVVTAPTHGTTAVQPNGSVTYTPAAGFVGTDSFRYTVTDLAGAVSAAGTVTVVVTSATGSGTVPVAHDDVADTDGNNPVAVDVLANDLASTGNALVPGSVSVVSGPARGTVSVNPATGAVTYTASGFFRGTDSFAYTVRDSGGATSAAGTVTVVVNRPTANDDFADTDGTNPVAVNILANDTDPDGNGKLDSTTVRVVTAPTHGSVAIDPATGEATYTAAAGFRGTDTFTYTVADLAGAVSATGTVTVVVNRPTANDDAAATALGRGVTIPVLANDTDPDGDAKLNPASVRVVTPPAHGTLTVDPATGAITYTPAAGFAGTDSFTYTVTDFPGAESNPATVTVRVAPPAAPPFTVLAADAGGGPRVTVLNADGSVRANFFAFAPSFAGGVRLAVGDVTGDGVADVVAAAGPGGGPQVIVYSGSDLSVARSFYAYDRSFAGGVRVAVGDVTGDGFADIVTGAGAGGAPHVKVFDGRTGALLASFFAFDASFAGGVTVAVGDVTGDGFADIIVAAGAGGAPHVKVFDGRTFALVRSFFAYPQSFTGGVSIAVGDLDGDGKADIVTGAGPGGGPNVKAFDGATGQQVASFLAFDAGFAGGADVGTTDADGDGKADIVVGAGPGGGPNVKVFDGRTFAPLSSTYAFGNDFRGGVSVG